MNCRFSVDSKLNAFKKQHPESAKLPGASHAEDLFYLFRWAVLWSIQVSIWWKLPLTKHRMYLNFTCDFFLFLGRIWFSRCTMKLFQIKKMNTQKLVFKPSITLAQSLRISPNTGNYRGDRSMRVSVPITCFHFYDKNIKMILLYHL